MEKAQTLRRRRAQMEKDLWALWPDDYMCEASQIEEMLSPPCARSDDYMLVNVLEYDEAFSPSRWEPIT